MQPPAESKANLKAAAQPPNPTGEKPAPAPGAFTSPPAPAAPTEADGNFPGYEPHSVSEPYARHRSLFVRAIYDTFGRPGARIAAVWITLLVVLAVFAPFIANSRPIVMRTAGGALSSPMLNAINWLDVTLVVAFFTVLGLVLSSRFLSFNFGHGLLVLIGVIAVASPLAAVITDPPANVVYESWRESEAAGEIDWAVRTIIPYSPNDRMNDRSGARQQPPGSEHWLGTTVYGEDMLARMIYATRIALAIGFIATGIATLIGVVVGGIMGYFAGWIDLIAMRAIEIIEAIPRLILLLIVTAFFGKNIWLMMITIGIVSWTYDARFVRAEFLKLRKQDFVQAGIATGLPLPNLLFRHMLPNGVAPVLVNASFGVAAAILLESTLSFLGLGLEADTASWGQLLNQARSGGTGFNWWIATFPGLAIFLTVFAYILIGEAMRDAIDPKLKKAGE